MNRASDLMAGQRGNHAFNVPPVAKMRDVAVVTRCFCPRRGFKLRVVAEPLDQFRSVGQSHTPMDEGNVHRHLIARQAFESADEDRQRAVDYSRAIGCGVRMNARTTQAGGCFLMLCILGGFAGGIALGNPMKGGLIGTAIGVLLAVLLWLIDRRRR